VSADAATRGLRIGELAGRAGTTPRTVRYYEEIGLLEPREERAAGRIGSTRTPISSASARSCG
jgi:hypothetical protein